MKDMTFGSKNVVSISAVCDDEKIAAVIRQSDYVRAETFRRCFQIASYKSKPVRWQNRYYDHFRRMVERELANG